MKIKIEKHKMFGLGVTYDWGFTTEKAIWIVLGFWFIIIKFK